MNSGDVSPATQKVLMLRLPVEETKMSISECERAVRTEVAEKLALLFALWHT